MPSPQEAIRIVIADDHGMVRDGLRALLAEEPGFDVVGMAADGEQAVVLADEQRPDVLLLDVIMPRMDGIGVLQQLRQRAWRDDVRVLLLTASVARETQTRALTLGARGIMLKDTTAELLFKGIRAVMAGEYWVRRDVVGDLVRALDQSPSPRNPETPKTFGLSERELDILRLVVEGFSNKEIGNQCSLSADTVKHHLSNIFDKAGVSSRVELARFAFDHGLLREPASHLIRQ